MTEHRLAAEPTHSRWNRALTPQLEIEPGDAVHFQCVEAAGGQVRPGMSLPELATIDRGRVHALTGPVFVRGAQRGDVLEVDILEIAHHGWGYSSVVPGLGFLKERFHDPFLFHWELLGDETRSLVPAVVPLRPFCGVMGVAPGVDGEFRTRPPGPFGGNMDVRELCAGARLYLPVFNAGALFSCGDGHAAQGDGEVCINGIECPLDVTLRFHLHRGHSLTAPLIESAQEPGATRTDSWIVVESSEDALRAAQTATDRMIDLLVRRWGLSDLHAYILCSVAMHLRLSQVVNEPMITVTASIAKHVLPERRLF
ncbi:MAG TPA: acetamidase/formamidase family protein [Acidobacteriaceae bacterium]|nr:acetamidase/formamidase family protein [Acidobacteriaceae bacterium]